MSTVEFMYARKVSIHSRAGEMVVDILDNMGNRYLFSAEPGLDDPANLDYYGSLSVPQREGAPMKRNTERR